MVNEPAMLMANVAQGNRPGTNSQVDTRNRATAPKLPPAATQASASIVTAIESSETLEAGTNLRLESPVGRLVVADRLEIVRPVRLPRRIRVRLVVRITIIAPVAEPLHQPRRRVAQVERHRMGRRPGHVFAGAVVRDVSGIALRHRSEIQHRLRER